MAIFIKENDKISKCESNNLLWIDILFDGLDRTTRFKKIFLNQAQIKGIENVVFNSIRTLPESTQNVIKSYYGILGSEKKCLCDIAVDCREWIDEYKYFENLVKEEYEELGKSIDEIEEWQIAEKILQSSIRRLWNPSRHLLRQCLNGINYSRTNYSSAFEFWKVLKDEIYNLITAGRDYHYLDVILKKHNISIESECIDDKDIDIKIENMGFSNRVLNCLSQKGIKDLYDLKLYSDESLMGIDNLGKGCLEEINEKKKIYGVETRGFSFTIKENGEKTVHRLKGISEKEIVQYIFEILFPDDRPNIFRDITISHGLLNLLLIKGYVFIDEIKKDKEPICQELLQSFPEYSEELKISFDQKVLYINCSDEIEEWINTLEISDVHELKKAVKKIETQKLQQEIISLFVEDEELLWAY